MEKISYSTIAQNGGVYTTSKYRYILTSTGEIKRCELSRLGTPDAWQVVTQIAK